MSYENFPFWFTEYNHGITIMIKNIFEIKKFIISFLKEDDNFHFIQGYYEYYKLIYLTNINICENTATQTIDLTEYALKCHTNNDLRYLKTRNLWNSYIYCLNNYKKLDLNLIKEVNKLIGNNLFDSGNIRSCYVKPNKSNYRYLDPNLINTNLNKLIVYINSVNINENNWYIVASEFLSTFLNIHPFINGNGRTAWILLSHIFREFSIIPISPIGKRDIYLKCLEEIELYNNKLLLRSFIIQSFYESLYTFFCVFRD